MTSRSSSWPWRAASPEPDEPEAERSFARRAVTLVQIDLRRRPAASEPDARDSVAVRGASEPARDDAASPDQKDSLLPASAGLALAGGLVLLAPLAVRALASTPAFTLLLAGLGVLGLIAALLRPALAEVDPP